MRSRGLGNGEREEQKLRLLQFQIHEAATTRGDRRRDWPGPGRDEKFVLCIYGKKQTQATYGVTGVKRNKALFSLS